MADFVSVVVCAYNAERFLPEAIESILNQTYTDFELLLVNDGSKDATLSIIQEYQKKDHRITIDTHENMGISKSSNRAIRKAKGNIIVRMDADDIMKPNRLEEQVKYLQENPEITMVSCDAEFVSEKGEKIGRQVMPGFNKPEDSKEILNKPILVACAHTGFTSYKEAILEVGGYNEEITCVVDLELFTRMLENGNVLIILRQDLMEYRMHGTSVMASGIKNKRLQNTEAWVIENMVRRRAGEKEYNYEEFLKFLDAKPWHVKWNRNRKQTAYYYYRGAGISYANKRYVYFVYYLALSILIHPERFIKKAFGHFLHKIKK